MHIILQSLKNTFERGQEVSNLLISLLLAGLCSHCDNALCLHVGRKFFGFFFIEVQISSAENGCENALFLNGYRFARSSISRSL